MFHADVSSRLGIGWLWVVENRGSGGIGRGVVPAGKAQHVRCSKPVVPCNREVTAYVGVTPWESTAAITFILVFPLKHGVLSGWHGGGGT